MKKYRFIIEIEAENETEAKKEFLESFGFDPDDKDGWYEISIEEIKDKR